MELYYEIYKWVPEHINHNYGDWVIGPIIEFSVSVNYYNALL